MPKAIFKVVLIDTKDDAYVIVGDYAFVADYNPGSLPYYDHDGHLDYEEACNIVREVKFSSLPDGSVNEFQIEVNYYDFQTDWIEREVAQFCLFEENHRGLEFRKL